MHLFYKNDMHTYCLLGGNMCEPILEAIRAIDDTEITLNSIYDLSLINNPITKVNFSLQCARNEKSKKKEWKKKQIRHLVSKSQLKDT